MVSKARKGYGFKAVEDNGFLHHDYAYRKKLRRAFQESRVAHKFRLLPGAKRLGNGSFGVIFEARQISRVYRYELNLAGTGISNDSME